MFNRAPRKPGALLGSWGLHSPRLGDAKNHRWTAEPGEFDIYVGPSLAQIELTGKVTLKNPQYEPISGQSLVAAAGAGHF